MTDNMNIKKVIGELVKNYPGIFVLAFLYIAAIAVIGIPRAPICDAWAYSKITKGFLESGSIHFIGYGAMNLVFHIFWGFLFCKLFGGFSFPALVVSTLVLSFIGSIVFYLIIKRLVPREPQASLASCLLVCNPIYLVCSFSFMTDVPFMCWMLLSLFFYLKSFEERGALNLALGSIFAVLSFLIRQQGICLIAAAFACYLFSSTQRKRLGPKRVAVLFIIPLASIATFTLWQHGQANVEKWHLFLRSARDGLFILEYCSLFSLALIFAYIPVIKNKAVYIISLAVVGINLLFSLLAEGRWMPYFAAWMTEFGVFTDQIIVGHRDYVLHPDIWLFVTIVAASGSVLLLSVLLFRLKSILRVFFSGRIMARRFFLIAGSALAFVFGLLSVLRAPLIRVYSSIYDYLYKIHYVKRPLSFNYNKLLSLHDHLSGWVLFIALLCLIVFALTRTLRSKNDSVSLGRLSPQVLPFSFVFLVTGFQLVLLFLMKDLADRYIIVLIPGTALFVLLGHRLRRYSHLLCAVILAIFFSYSALVAADTYAWNDAAWRAGDHLASRKIDPRSIDAGLAWDGWHFNEPITPELDLITPRSKIITTWYLGGMFSKIDNEYTVSSSELDGYDVILELPYNSLLGYILGKSKRIYMLKRR